MSFQYPILLEIIVSLLLLLGSSFIALGALALNRLPDFFSRLHGPPMATTMGMGAILFASLIFFTVTDGMVQLHELLVVFFLFLSGPVSGYMLAKAAVLQQLPMAKQTRGTPWEQ